MTTRIHSARALAAIGLAFAAGCCLVGCEGSSNPVTSTDLRSAVSSQAATAPVGGIVEPGPPSFSTPRAAVQSYLAWVSLAYEAADSDVATMVFTPAEEVRINSYVQLNSERGRRMRQQLLSLDLGEGSRVGSATLLPAREVWHYRYLELASARAVSPTYTATYDTTYTLVPRAQGGWIVDAVEAAPRAAVK